jgi:hypothetical protein
MIPPLVSFVTWNRMGLNVRNLKALLKTSEDFELHITDSSSGDYTWEFICGIRDSRIASKTRLEMNRGPIYATNLNLSRRKAGQYFITVDSDVNIHTDKWISEYMKIFEMFPEAGLLGAVSSEYYSRYRLPFVVRDKKGTRYFQIHAGFVEGCCQCIRPELMDVLGYWCEESCMGDEEICYRICNYTSFTAGFAPAIDIDMRQEISCSECEGRDVCCLDKSFGTCFDIRRRKYANPKFRDVNGWKYEKCKEEMEEGRRTVYRASIHDPESMRNHLYNMEWALGNFDFYINNSN